MVHRLRVLEKRVLRSMFGPKTDKVTGSSKRLYNKELNPLTPNDLYIRRAVSPLNSRTTCICVANSVSKFGATLFTPIRLNVVACDALGPLKVRHAFRCQNVPLPLPKPLHKHRHKCRQLVTVHFSQLTNTVVTQLAASIACTGVHCGLKYQHWPMKRSLVVDQKGCQWHTVPI